MKILNFSPILIILFCSSAFAFEHTKVLPQGIRNFTVHSIHTTIREKTDDQGENNSIAKPLNQNLTFEKVAANESHIKQTQIKALLLSEGLTLEDSLGSFTADMQGSIAVTAPVLSYGITENLTFAIAIPYYRSKMDVELGFKTNPEIINPFLTGLQSRNQTHNANKVVDKLNNAVEGLQEKLDQNGYQRLENWEGEHIGDVTLATKWRPYNKDKVKIATTQGLILPTGKVDNPDILNDIPTGKGSLQLLTGISIDQYLISNVFLNQYVKYQHPFVSKKDVRLKTADEKIAVEKARARYFLGDLYQIGASLQYEPTNGFVSGLGYIYEKQYEDRYDINHSAAKEELQKNTQHTTHFVEAKIGYSSVQAFKNGKFPVPLATNLEFKKHIKSQNSFTNDLMTANVALFF